MHKQVLVALVIFAGIVCSEANSCKSCGSECQAACGTRHFRTCCFNYNKKRSDLAPEPPLPLSLDPSLRLELWLAKSKLPYWQKYNEAATILDNSLDLDDSKQRFPLN